MKKAEEANSIQNTLPESGFVRVEQIVGNKKKGIWPPIVPVSKSSWWAGVASGKYPAAIKLSERTTCWTASSIWKLIESAGEDK